MMHSTGPKISSCAIVMRGSTSAKTVGRTKYPPAGTPSGRSNPPATSRAPSSIPDRMYPLTLSHWAADARGPMSPLPPSGSSARTTRTASYASAATSTISSYLSRGTIMRARAEHVCPEFSSACRANRSTSAGSASSNTTHADLPPSSDRTRLSLGEAPDRWTRRPAFVDPVNETMSERGWDASASPAAAGPAPVPETRLNTPGGRTPSASARSTTSASTNALRGATSLGFSTIEHPANRAGTTLAAI
mmetsp:Transcript_40727/g.122675  ORF Transcript_40727/g.122675 Transcript_40727/m.122675 type:complete len:248 (-) Transcript_40727:770-1513(-)